jgi:hypothetical protein
MSVNVIERNGPDCKYVEIFNNNNNNNSNNNNNIML